jgi:uncharacterized membrane protein SirB2
VRRGMSCTAAEFPQMRFVRTRRIVAGTLLAIAGVLLIVATHWCQFY